MGENGRAASPVSRGHRLPLWVKLFHTAFLAVLVPVYWAHYGPGNFLWFSDVALFVLLPALWLESPLLASTQAVSVAALELSWLGDFLIGLTAGASPFGLSAYMFDSGIPLPIRGLSLFHVWLPFLLLWLAWRLGHDRRAWLVQTAIAWVVLPLSYLLTEPAANVNWVFGTGKGGQEWAPPLLYLLLLMAFFPACIYLPSHLILCTLFPPPDGAGTG